MKLDKFCELFFKPLTPWQTEYLKLFPVCPTKYKILINAPRRLPKKMSYKQMELRVFAYLFYWQENYQMHGNGD